MNSKNSLDRCKHYFTNCNIYRFISFGFFSGIGAISSYLLFHYLNILTSLSTCFIIAFFIAVILNPVMQFFIKRGFSQWFSLFLILFSFFTLLTIFILKLIPSLFSQFNLLTNNMHEYLVLLKNSSLIIFFNQYYNIQEIIDECMNNLKISINNVKQILFIIFRKIVSIFIIFVLVIYFLIFMQDKTTHNSILQIIPKAKQTKLRLLKNKIIISIQRYFIGQISVSALNACFVCIMMIILKIPLIILITSFVAIFAFIPLIGGVVSLCFVSLFVLLFNQKVIGIFILSYIIYLQIEAYIIHPHIMSKTTSLPALISLISIMIGGLLFGILGAIIAIPFISMVWIFCKEIFNLKKN